MTAPDCQFSFMTDSSPAEALDKIRRVSDWWTRHIEGKMQHLNDSVRVTSGETLVIFVVFDEVPERSLAWRVTDCNLHWINNKKE